jgi:hypothetical protein
LYDVDGLEVSGDEAGETEEGRKGKTWGGRSELRKKRGRSGRGRTTHADSLDEALLLQVEQGLDRIEDFLVAGTTDGRSVLRLQAPSLEVLLLDLTVLVNRTDESTVSSGTSDSLAMWGNSEDRSVVVGERGEVEGKDGEKRAESEKNGTYATNSTSWA